MTQWTQAEVDKLRKAIASGVKSLTLGDTAMSFHSLTEMRDLLRTMESSVAAQAGQKSPRTVLVQHDRGI